MLFYLFSNGNTKNHPLLLKILPTNNQENIRSFLGGVIVYCIAYVILFSPLFKFEVMEMEKYFWAIFTIDILFTYAYLYQNTEQSLETVRETQLENRLNSILKKRNNTYVSSKNVKFERVREEETEIDTGDSEFDLTEFKNSL
jgi:hypothetical protein